jgi:hypothetical protein
VLTKESIPLFLGFVAALVTAIGWLVSYRQAQTGQLRKDRLDLINRQLSEFYGPLHVACVAGEAAYKALLAKLGRGGVFSEEDPPSEEDLKEWFHWMKHVFMPLNELREKIVLEKLHLLRETETPPEIFTLAAHVAAYRALLAKWEKGDFREQYSRIDFPRALGAYVAKSFAELKQEQSRLRGLLKE